MRGTPWAPSKRILSLLVEFHLVGGFATLGVDNWGKGCQIDALGCLVMTTHDYDLDTFSFSLSSLTLTTPVSLAWLYDYPS